MTTNDIVDPDERTLADLLAENWWLLALRGVAAVLFGILAFIWPGITLVALVYLFGAYALANGILSFALAFKGRKGRRSSMSLIFGGIISIVTALITFFLPGITALGLVLLIAAWAIANGVTEIVAAIRLRKVITNEWLLVLAGIFSILFGIILLLQPGVGALALVFWIGAWMILIGVLLMILAFRVRNLASMIGTRTRTA
jgi:uncharacterized membrane protein HdeD (DUF308 family)